MIIYVCHQNVAFVHEVEGSKGAIYRVVWKYQFEGPLAGAYGWECSCPNYQFRLKKSPEPQQCKHITSVVAKGERCTWNSDYTDRTNPRWCPKCGGPTVAQDLEEDPLQKSLDHLEATNPEVRAAAQNLEHVKHCICGTTHNPWCPVCEPDRDFTLADVGLGDDNDQ